MNLEELRARRDALLAQADKCSAEIRLAEEFLRETPTVSVEFGTISWDAQSKRIMMGDRPLIEHKLEKRIDGHWYLQCLIDRVLLETEESFSKAGGIG